MLNARFTLPAMEERDLADLFRKPRAGPMRLVAYLIIFPGLAAALNAWIFSTGAAEWAASLQNPAWAPAGPVIGAVWVVMFALMAVSLWLVDRAGRLETRGAAQALILAQYLVNIGWTGLYFGLRDVSYGFYVTVAALALSIAAFIAIWRANRTAALLFAPLVIWLGLALPLSYATWQLNV